MLRVRWLGSVRYAEALDLQRRLWQHSENDYLLLVEHEPVYTAGVSAEAKNLLVDPASVGAEFAQVERGGDITFHGPGQLTGYPILTLETKRGGGLAETARYVHQLEQTLIDALSDLGLGGCGRLDRYPGVWADPTSGAPKKIAAIGVRLRRGRTLHGFALNVSTDLGWYDHIVACGIAEFGVSSLADQGIDVSVKDAAEVIAARARTRFGYSTAERAAVTSFVPIAPAELSASAGTSEKVPRSRFRLAGAGVVGGLEISERKPAWLKASLDINAGYKRFADTMKRHELVTVCEEAGCPNIYECWGAGTATFMINGADCTRACGFCLVGTAKPQPLDLDEPARVAAAVAEMGLAHAVITAVARDDLADGGAAAFAATIAAIRSRPNPPSVEVLIPDFAGDEKALQAVIEAQPEVANHNLETVARLQRAVRPQAGYARSLATLARLADAGLVTKSGLIAGMGETDAEVDAALADLAGVGVSIVTIGQYLRPTAHHIPVARWVDPSSFERWREVGQGLGIGHVESSPLTRSSYHARDSFTRLSRSAK